MRWRIRNLMADKSLATGDKITYEKITEATGISPNTLSKLATGRAELVGVATIEALLDYFNCQPNDLMVIVKDKSN